MEYQRITNLLGVIPENETPKFMAKKWIEVFDHSDGTYNVNKDIRFKTPQLMSDLYDWEEAYLVGTGKITVPDPNNNAYDKKLALKNNALFMNRWKINRRRTRLRHCYANV